MLLQEIQHIRAEPGDGPVIVFARHHGRYVRPVEAYELDMRLEDNPAVPKEYMRLDATWIARHPTEDYYVVYDGLDKSNTVRLRVPAAALPGWEANWSRARARLPKPGSPKAIPLPDRVFRLPTAGIGTWWLYVVAYDRSKRMVKAALKTRQYDLTPEEVDERGGEQPDLATRLDRVYGASG